jgi:hypothetical protein
MIINDFERLALRKFKIKSILPDATILCLGKRRCLARGTNVLLYNGTVKLVENITREDILMGDDGTPRHILELTSGSEMLYTVTNELGGSYSVNSAHVLSLKWMGPNGVYHSKRDSVYRVCWFDTNEHCISVKTFPYTEEYRTAAKVQACCYYKQLNNSIDVDMSLEEYLSLPSAYQNMLHGYKARDGTQCVSDELSVECQDPYEEAYQLLSEPNLLARSEHTRMGVMAFIIDSYFIMQAIGSVALYLPSTISIAKLETLAGSLGMWVRTDGSGICYLTGSKLPYLPCKRMIIDESFQNAPQSSPISIQEDGVGEFYGFLLTGNHRFLLHDFTVTHNSGKSFLVRDMFYHHRHIPSGIVFSGTEEASPFFSDFVPDCFIHSEYDPELIQDLLNRQKRKIREAKLTGKSESGKMLSNNVFVVLDDMLHDAQSWKKDKTIKNIFFNGRHFNLLFILTMQYAQAIPPELRSNIDYVFIFNESSVANRKKIYEAYAGMIPSFEHFCNILDACTQNHECLVIKTSGNSADLRDQVFWYKAKAHSNFKAGHRAFWNYHQSHYNEQYEDEAEQDQEELDKLKKKFAKTRKLKVIVSRQGDVVGYKQDSDEE